jgi:hypothetical protein
MEKEALYTEWGEGTKKEFYGFLDTIYTGKYDFLLIDNKEDKKYKNFVSLS